MDSYNKAWKSIVQPPSCTYNEDKDLPTEFVAKKEMIKRHKFLVPSCDPDEHLNINFYHSEERQIKHILIYMHSFSGSAIEGYFLLEYFLPKYSVILFDQRGCGNNKSEFVTLGLRESIDLNLLIQHLYQRFGEVSIYLWGKSMGAAAIVHFLHQIEAQIFYFQYRMAYGKSSKSIIKLKKMNNFLKFKNDEKQARKALKEAMKQVVYPLKKLNEKQFNEIVNRYSMVKRVIYDSPFPSSHSIIKQIMIHHQKVSKVMAQLALVPVQHSVKSVLGYDVLGKNKPYQKSHLIQIPGMFIIGEKDELVDFNKFKVMFDEYASPEKKLRIMLNLDHGMERPDSEIKVAKAFLFKDYVEDYKNKKSILEQEVEEMTLNQKEKNKNSEMIGKDQTIAKEVLENRSKKNLMDMDGILIPKELDQIESDHQIEELKRDYNDMIVIDKSEDSLSFSSLSEENQKEEQQFIEELKVEVSQRQLNMEKEDLKKNKGETYEFKDQFNQSLIIF